MTNYNNSAINFSISYVKYAGSSIMGDDQYKIKRKIIPLKKSSFKHTAGNFRRLWVFWKDNSLSEKEGYLKDMSGSFNLISFDNDNG